MLQSQKRREGGKGEAGGAAGEQREERKMRERTEISMPQENSVYFMFT